MSVEATFGETPAWSSHVAALWRASCRPIGSWPRSRHSRCTRSWMPPSDRRPETVLPGRADLARGGSTLPNPRLPQDQSQRIYERHHRPGAARLAAFLVGGQLEGAELQVDVEPVERADLLLPRRAVAGERIGHRVLEFQRVEKLGELGWRRDTVTGRRIH